MANVRQFRGQRTSIISNLFHVCFEIFFNRILLMIQDQLIDQNKEDIFKIVRQAIEKHKDSYDGMNIRDLIDIYLQKQHDPRDEERLSGTFTYYARTS